MSEKIKVICPKCDKRLSVNPSLAGKRVRCPDKTCAAVIKIPTVEIPEEDLEEESPKTSPSKRRRSSREMNDNPSSSPDESVEEPVETSEESAERRSQRRLEGLAKQLDAVSISGNVMKDTTLGMIKRAGKALILFANPDKSADAQGTLAGWQRAFIIDAHGLGKYHPAVILVLKINAIVVAIVEGRPEPTDAELAKQFEPKNCFIATAACGSAQAEDVVRLRQFREIILRPSYLGRMIIRVYETVSPPFAAIIARAALTRCLVRYLIVHPARLLADLMLRC